MDLSGRKKLSAAMAAVFLAGLVLRLLMVGRTDITHDEASFAVFSFKLAALIAQYPAVLLAAFAAIALGLWVFLKWKNGLRIFCAAGAAIIFVKYFFAVPYLAHAQPDLYYVFITLGIFFSGLEPHIVAELVSVAASMAIAVAGYLIAKRLGGKKAGAAAFALLALSPYGVFFSTAIFADTLAMAFLAFGIWIFFRSFDDNGLFPYAGILVALAVATRFTALFAVPPMLVFYYVKRHRVSGKNFRLALKFFAVVAFAFLFYFGQMLVQLKMSNTSTFINETSPRTDFLEAHYSGLVFSAFNAPRTSVEPLYLPKAMSAFYSPILTAVLLVAVAGAAFLGWRRKNPETLFLAALFLEFAVFFSFIFKDQRINYLMEIEILAVSLSAAFLLSGTEKLLPEKKAFAAAAGRILAAGIVAIFLFQPVAVIREHYFRSFS